MRHLVLNFFFPHQDYKYFCFCNNGQFNIVRKPYWSMVGPPGAKPPSKFYDNLYENTTWLFLCSASCLCVVFATPHPFTIMRLMRTLYSHGHILELQEWIEFFTLFFLNTDQSNLSVISFFLC